MANAGFHWVDLYQEERNLIRRAEEALVTERLSFERWLDIGAGLHSMQLAVMRLAHTNRPIGKAYNEAYKRIEQRLPELQKVDPGTRTDAIWLWENAERVRQWRTTLSEAQRDKWNNPRTLRRRFEEMTIPAPQTEAAPRADKNAIIAAQEERIDELEKRTGKVAGDQFDLQFDRPRDIARVLIEQMQVRRVEALIRELQQQLQAFKRVAVRVPSERK